MGIEFYILNPRSTKPVEASREEVTNPHAPVAVMQNPVTSGKEPSASPDANDTVMMFNWGSWRPVEAAMIELGMVVADESEPAPDLTAVGWDGPCSYEVLGDPSLPEDAADAIWDWLKQEPAACGIPHFKLGNDFWIVTPDEIRSALAQLEGKPVPDVPRWDEWIAFLHRATDSAGMQVW